MKLLSPSFKFFLFVLVSLASSKAFAQTFPASCPSKDLELVSAALTGGDMCHSCTPGDSLTRTLTLGINNKTGSTRNAFAFWATLEITRADNTVATVTIARCSGPIPPTGPYPAAYFGDFGTIRYKCGDALRLLDLHLAWTDAANNNKTTCSYVLSHSSTIDPKCGVLPSIEINAGINARFASITNVTCFGGATGAIDLTPFGGTPFKVGPPYTYSWSTSDGSIPAGQATSQDLTGLTKGHYAVRITDSLGCYIDKTAEVTGPSAGLSLGTCSKTDVTCFGGANGTVTAGTPSNAVGIVSYLWKKGATTAGTTANLTGLTVGTYDLTVSDNCSSQTCSVTIGGPSAALSLGTCSKTDVTCFGGSNGSISAGTVTNAVGTVTYVWKKGTTTVGNTPTVSNRDAGTYVLTVTDNCSSQTCTVTVGGPSAALALGTCTKTDVTCFGGANGTVTAGTVSNAVGTVSYLWKKGATTVGTTANLTGLTVGTYDLTVTDNCSSQTCSVAISGPSAALSLGTCSKTDVTCFGGSNGSVSAGTVTNAVGTVTYLWKKGATTVGTTATVNNRDAGTYVLTVTDNCSSQTCTVTIGGPSAALALGTCTKTDVTCAGSDGSVTAGTVTNSIGTVHYSWKNASNVVVGGTANVGGLDAGTYTLTVTDDCSSQTCNVTVSAPPALPTPAASVTQQPTCAIAKGTVTVTSPDANTTYTLTQSGVIKYTAVNGVFNSVDVGIYVLTASIGVCSKNGNNVTVNPQPSTPAAPALCILQQVSLCGPATGSIRVTSPTGAGYQYSKDNGVTWQPGTDFTGLAAGSNPSIIVKNADGCISAATSCSEASSTCPANIARAVSSVTEATSIEPSVKAYPNPFSDKIKFVVTSPAAGRGNLEIYNMMGQRVRTVYQGYIVAGTQTFELNLPTQQIANLVYVLRIGDKKLSGKILQINQ